MNKLSTQTVYIPVEYATPFIMEETGMLGREYMSPKEERIILTPQELNDLLLEYHPRMVNDPQTFNT